MKRRGTRHGNGGLQVGSGGQRRRRRRRRSRWRPRWPRAGRVRLLWRRRLFGIGCLWPQRLAPRVCLHTTILLKPKRHTALLHANKLSHTPSIPGSGCFATLACPRQRRSGCDWCSIGRTDDGGCSGGCTLLRTKAPSKKGRFPHFQASRARNSAQPTAAGSARLQPQAATACSWRGSAAWCRRRTVTALRSRPPLGPDDGTVSDLQRNRQNSRRGLEVPEAGSARLRIL